VAPKRWSQSYAWLLQWFKRGQKDEKWKLTERRNFTPCGLWSRLDFTFSKSAACFWVIHVPFSKALECCGYSSCLFCREISVLIRFSSSYLAPFQASHPHEISSFPAATMLWRVLAVLTSSFADRPDFSYWIQWYYIYSIIVYTYIYKSKGFPRQAEVAQGVPGRLRPWIFLTFRDYKGSRSSAKRTARLYPRRNPWYFQRLSLPQGTWFCRGYHGKNPQWHHRE